MLSNSVKMSSAITITAGAAGTTEIDGTSLDMTGFEGVLMTCRFGAITSGAVTTIKAQDSSDNSNWNDIAGSAQTIADTDDEKMFYIDVYKPQLRYIRLVVTRSTQNAVVASGMYHQYGPVRKLPVTQGTNVSGEQFVSPDDGTA